MSPKLPGKNIKPGLLLNILNRVGLDVSKLRR